MWADWADDQLYSARVTGAGRLTGVHTTVQGGLQQAEGLAVDWVGGNLYWVQVCSALSLVINVIVEAVSYLICFSLSR